MINFDYSCHVIWPLHIYMWTQNILSSERSKLWNVNVSVSANHKLLLLWHWFLNVEVGLWTGREGWHDFVVLLMLQWWKNFYLFVLLKKWFALINALWKKIPFQFIFIQIDSIPNLQNSIHHICLFDKFFNQNELINCLIPLRQTFV